MERLTKCGYQFSLLNVLQGLTRYTEIDEILNQLAAYEDTGFSTADIPALTARAEAAEAERDAAALKAGENVRSAEFCPKCETELSRDVQMYDEVDVNYCPVCGTKIDWEE